MVPNNFQIIILVDDGPVNKAIHTSLLKSLPVVKEVVECQNGLEALNYITRLKIDDSSSPEIIVLDLKKPYLGTSKFLDFFHLISKPKENNKQIIVVSSPDFFEDILKVSIPGFGFKEKPFKIQNNLLSDFFEGDAPNVTLPGFNIIEKPVQEEKEMESNRASTSSI